MSTATSDKVDLGNYEVLTEFSLEYAPVTVTKYRSKKTGFQVVVGNHKGEFPLSLSTEIRVADFL
jgi:hypothetical protein